MKKNLFTLCMMLLLSMLSFAQGSLTISGVVTEKKTGEPIIGASILLKGQSSGTITDFNGNYSIPNVPSGATLVFSYIGMKTQEVKVTASSKLDISLEEDNQLIDEVVVIGYGIQRKSDLTGSVGAVKSKDLRKLPLPTWRMPFRDVSPVCISRLTVLPEARPKYVSVVSAQRITAIPFMWWTECLWTTSLS